MLQPDPQALMALLNKLLIRAPGFVPSDPTVSVGLEAVGSKDSVPCPPLVPLNVMLSAHAGVTAASKTSNRALNISFERTFIFAPVFFPNVDGASSLLADILSLLQQLSIQTGCSCKLLIVLSLSGHYGRKNAPTRHATPLSVQCFATACKVGFWGGLSL